MKTKKKEEPVDYDLVRADYEPDALQDEDTIYKIKEAINSLNPAEYRIYITYLERGTYTAVAREFNCSAPTAKRKISDITDKILNYGNIH